MSQTDPPYPTRPDLSMLFLQAHKDTIIFVHKVFGEAAEELRDIIPPDALHSR